MKSSPDSWESRWRAEAGKQALRLPAGNGPEIVRSFGPIKACAALWKTHNAAHYNDPERKQAGTKRRTMRRADPANLAKSPEETY